MTNKRYFLAAGIVALSMMATGALAQNLQSVSNYSKMHSNLLAKQNRIQDQIKLEEAQRYAADLYEEVEPEPDIYTEGWESDRVNPYKESQVPNSKVINVTGYVMPVKGNYVTSHYGYRPAFGRSHKGVDLRAAMGDTVRATFSGRVRLTKYERGGFGFYVIVRHENGLETVYGHLSRFLVQPNQYVKAGINPEAIFDFENRVTHTDKYTFNKSNYTQARNYSPGARYASVRHHSRSAKSSDKVSSRSTGKHRSAARSTYKVRKGDNLGKIAARSGMSVAQLKRINGIKGNKVQAGKVLRTR